MTEFNGLPSDSSGSPRIERISRIRHLTRQLTNTVLDLVFPPKCIGCDRHVGSVFCAACQSTLKSVEPIYEVDSPLIARCATAEFSGHIQKAIHHLKYSGQRSLAAVLAQRLANTLRDTGWQPTLITAVPLHPNRMKHRGYNQSTLLASKLSEILNISFHDDLVQRIKDTPPQVGLTKRARQENVSGAFKAVSDKVRGQEIAIIDDVYTTGATMRACASALREAGASKVWALTVASAANSHSGIADATDTTIDDAVQVRS